MAYAGYQEEDFNREEVITVIGSIFNNDYELDVYWGLFYPELCQKLTPTLKEIGLSDEQIAEFMENFKEQIIALKPEMLDGNLSDWTEGQAVLARQLGAELWPDCLGESDNEGGWQRAVDLGSTGIQSDKPEDLIDFLTKQGRR